MKSESITLALSRQLAMADNRNPQAAVMHTARALRAETKSKETYKALGEFITCTAAERQIIMEATERMIDAH